MAQQRRDLLRHQRVQGAIGMALAYRASAGTTSTVSPKYRNCIARILSGFSVGMGFQGRLGSALELKFVQLW